MRRISTPALSLRRSYAKHCDVADFADPALRARGQELRPDIDVETAWDRKTWELAMASFFLEETGVVGNPSASVLSVGAGREALLFWLAARVGHVLAADTYGGGEFAASDAPAAMVTDPARFSPYDRPVPNLEARALDARAMGELPDGYFDAVYSLSSIEHFGSAPDIRRAATEIGRVVRPGGYVYLATELVLEQAPRAQLLARAAVARASGGRIARREVFTLDTLRRDVLTPSGLELLQPIETAISPASFDNLATRRLRRMRYRRGTFHPHIVVRVGGDVFTSVGLPLRRP